MQPACYILVDKNNEPYYGSGPFWKPPASDSYERAAAYCEPNRAPFRLIELTPKPAPVGYVVLDKDQELFGFYKKKSDAKFNMNVGNEFDENQHRPYTLHEVI